jgi:hypothetical protein
VRAGVGVGVGVGGSVMVWRGKSVWRAFSGTGVLKECVGVGVGVGMECVGVGDGLLIQSVMGIGAGMELG